MNRLVTRNVIVLQFLLSSVMHAACNAAVPQQKKMPITTASETAREAYKQGMTLFHNARSSDALLHFEKAVAEDTNFILAVVAVANTQPRFKEMFEIMNQAYNMLERVEVSEGERIYVLAAHAAINSDAETQSANLTKLAEMFPEDDDILLQLAGYHWGRRDYQKSQQIYKQVVAFKPDSAPAQNMLGYSNWRLGKYQEAKAAFLKNIELTPDEPNAYDSLAELLLKTGRYKESIEVYKEALKIDPLFEFSHVG
ncbi:MAG: tetratricopeptide repeat protein, partial [Calditrichaeota bacterium]|nr:tetratricopeptide repeat protein [Calditrichota bacterium]